ncbi:MAG TPA: amino acid adenylation domain-containing protein [Ktedonobacteraceae bacterium]|nr:amino acid adenylation domain-containing protein [Ktedonobacteraceae bacterium]
MQEEAKLASEAPFEGFNLSPQQKHVWQIWNSDCCTYSTIYQMTFHGSLDTQALERATQRVLQKYEIFRTSFQRLSVMDLPLQVIQDEALLSWDEFAANTLPEDRQEAALAAYIDQIAATSFNPAQGPCIHFYLLSLDKDEHTLLIHAAALCADSRTFSLLGQQIHQQYHASLQGPEAEILQYADLSEWLNELLLSDDMLTARKYWEANLKPALLLKKLPGEQGRQSSTPMLGQHFHGITYRGATLQNIDALISRYQTSHEVFFLACWKALVWYSTGESDFIIGTAADGRRHEMLRDALGPLTRYLPLASQINAEDTFHAVIQQTSAQLESAHQWQDYYPWKQDLDPTLFLRLAFDYNYLPDVRLSPELSVSNEIVSSWIDRFGIKLSCTRSESALTLRWSYASNLFSPQSIAYLNERLLVFIAMILSEPDMRLKDMMLLGSNEQEQLLEKWNATRFDYQKSGILHQLFEAQVEQYPAHPALLFGGEKVSYATLNERANQLAHWLQKRGIGPESLVAICMERSIEMIVGILGILKAGGAYIPIGSENPRTRIDAMLADVQFPLLITHQPLAHLFEHYQGVCLFLDTEVESEGIQQESIANPAVVVSPANVAYVIYTSGSTGDPKGVMIPHSAVCNRLYWGQQHNPLVSQDRVLQVTAFGFDVAVWEIFAPLAVGACLVIAAPDKQQDTHYLCGLIRQERISVIHFVPTLLRAFLADPASQQCTSIRYIACGGEVLLLEDQRRFYQTLRAELHNPYGPTEATIDATYWICTLDQQEEVIPIGNCIANLRAFVLDELMRPVPIGRPGELYLGGAGLARGYHQQTALTSEKFVPDPFSPTPGERLYRTGDLVAYRPDGVLLFLGRLDQQVKLHGFRIELGEIESVLARHELVEQCIVIVAHEEGRESALNQRLIAYIVPRKTLPPDDFPSVSEWQKALYQHLPSYMIPAFFISLETLPLTPNGKVDRKALPSLQSIISAREEHYIAPRNAIEEVLADLWSEILEVPRVSIQDTFTELGGHSLIAMQLVSRIRDIFQIELPLRMLFEQPSVTEQANALIELESKAGQAEKIAQIFLRVQRMSQGDITHVLEKKNEKEEK